MRGWLRKAIVSCALVFVVGVYATAGSLLHLHKVEVVGDSWAVSKDDVRHALVRSGTLTLAFADFDELERAIKELPNVRDAQVRLLPPHRIELEVASREAVGRAVDGGLIDITGEWYPSTGDGELPIFAMARSDMPQAVEYLAATREKLEEGGIGITQLHHSDQGWRIFLSNGWVLLLGEQMIQRRLDRFAASLPSLRARLDNGINLRFDLRYPHGMAVAGWKRNTT